MRLSVGDRWILVLYKRLQIKIGNNVWKTFRNLGPIVTLGHVLLNIQTSVNRRFSRIWNKFIKSENFLVVKWNYYLLVLPHFNFEDCVYDKPCLDAVITPTGIQKVQNFSLPLIKRGHILHKPKTAGWLLIRRGQDSTTTSANILLTTKKSGSYRTNVHKY